MNKNERITELEAEVERLKVLVDEWQLDGVKSFTIHKIKLARPIELCDGDIATVSFGVRSTGKEVVVGQAELPDAPRGTYDHAIAFVFTDAFGMQQGFGGAIGVKAAVAQGGEEFVDKKVDKNG